MDCRTGEIRQLDEAELREMQERYVDTQQRAALQHRKMVALTKAEAEDLEPQPPQKRKNWMRNQPCPCDSGKKFKRCCWSKFS